MITGVRAQVRRTAMRAVAGFIAPALLSVSGCVSPPAPATEVSGAPEPTTAVVEPSLAIPAAEAKSSGLAATPSVRRATVAPPPPSPAQSSALTADDSPLAEVATPEVVVAASSLSGYWKVIGPKFVNVSVGLFSGVRIDYSADSIDRNICLIDDHAGVLTGICSAGEAKPAVGRRDGDRVVLRWWNGPLTVNFAGTIDGGSLVRGSISGGVVGMSVTGTVPMMLTRVAPEDRGAADPASAPMLRAVLADLQARQLTPGRYAPEALVHLEAALARPVTDATRPRVAYLGQIHIRWQVKQAEKVQDVYEVATATRQQLCRIAVGEDGTVADFECRAVAL